ncbi:phenylacetate-CoA oxygenase subunit PaaC [Kribbella solani]|uniref:1,2-phenylacetyl-CoA epoxidase subunit PaaC n=1 Tax=Kribbella solani TaxID=236067 RepID=UPI0029AA8B7C|nr:1,2-phenylacetyl-CoA epoxidase subunit PaaC [Kribbella solani]MDX2969388.1 phenylacetate-CoA oxygenase subunit PaaC [Kribbella solani]MDX3000315.1 phenylacetate-CoA oxygenase subunit PaaC [Kribbella solani]
MNHDLFEYTLRLGDDALIAAQRTGEWIAAAPQLEEDVALGNIGLDQLGQARSLLQYAGSAAGRTEDELAYFRDEREFRNLLICELPNGDFGFAMARLLYFATYQHLLYDELRSSADETLAGVAGKAVKEVAYHVDHATQWVLRLGDGTEESHRRMQAGLDELWPYTAEMFTSDELVRRLPVAVDPAGLQDAWTDRVLGVVDQSTCERPSSSYQHTGGREGKHTEHLGYLLAELQHIARSHPGATW